MNAISNYATGRMVLLALSLAWFQAASAQTFSSGSTGADGAFSPASNLTITVRPGGVYNYTTVNIPAGRTITFVRGSDNSPLVILATGNVTISGQIRVDGSTGIFVSGLPVVGGNGGPGGFRGGSSKGPGFDATAGEGPAGGQPTPGTGTGFGGTYGAPTNFVTLTPLFGGSGGGGSGGSGGGGGGAILIASSTRITMDGSILANGGATEISNTGCSTRSGGGAGGAIRLVAPLIAGSAAGFLQATGGGFAGCPASVAGNGRIRLEASNFSGFFGQANPVASIANAPGPVSAAGDPALVNVPTLAIASIGGLTVPTVPTASYAAPDLTLAPGTANPIPVVLNAANTPVGAPTQITVRVTPRSPGTASNVDILPAAHTGTFASSTASANVTLPAGQVTLLQAFATVTLTGGLAKLFPDIDGEPVERVRVATTPGELSTMSLVMASGKEVRVDALGVEDRIQVARAWEVMKVTQVE